MPLCGLPLVKSFTDAEAELRADTEAPAGPAARERLQPLPRLAPTDRRRWRRSRSSDALPSWSLLLVPRAQEECPSSPSSRLLARAALALPGGASPAQPPGRLTVEAGPGSEPAGGTLQLGKGAHGAEEGRLAAAAAGGEEDTAAAAEAMEAEPCEFESVAVDPYGSFESAVVEDAAAEEQERAAGSFRPMVLQATADPYELAPEPEGVPEPAAEPRASADSSKAAPAEPQVRPQPPASSQSGHRSPGRNQASRGRNRGGAEGTAGEAPAAVAAATGRARGGSRGPPEEERWREGSRPREPERGARAERRGSRPGALEASVECLIRGRGRQGRPGSKPVMWSWGSKVACAGVPQAESWARGLKRASAASVAWSQAVELEQALKQEAAQEERISELQAKCRAAQGRQEGEAEAAAELAVAARHAESAGELEAWRERRLRAAAELAAARAEVAAREEKTASARARARLSTAAAGSASLELRAAGEAAAEHAARARSEAVRLRQAEEGQAAALREPRGRAEAAERRAAALEERFAVLAAGARAREAARAERDTREQARAREAAAQAQRLAARALEDLRLELREAAASRGAAEAAAEGRREVLRGLELELGALRSEDAEAAPQLQAARQAATEREAAAEEVERRLASERRRCARLHASRAAQGKEAEEAECALALALPAEAVAAEMAALQAEQREGFSELEGGVARLREGEAAERTKARVLASELTQAESQVKSWAATVAEMEVAARGTAELGDHEAEERRQAAKREAAQADAALQLGMHFEAERGRVLAAVAHAEFEVAGCVHRAEEAEACCRALADEYRACQAKVLQAQEAARGMRVGQQEMTAKYAEAEWRASKIYEAEVAEEAQARALARELARVRGAAEQNAASGPAEALRAQGVRAVEEKVREHEREARLAAARRRALEQRRAVLRTERDSIVAKLAGAEQREEEASRDGELHPDGQPCFTGAAAGSLVGKQLLANHSAAVQLRRLEGREAQARLAERAEAARLRSRRAEVEQAVAQLERAAPPGTAQQRSLLWERCAESEAALARLHAEREAAAQALSRLSAELAERRAGPPAAGPAPRGEPTGKLQLEACQRLATWQKLGKLSSSPKPPASSPPPRACAAAAALREGRLPVPLPRRAAAASPRAAPAGPGARRGDHCTGASPASPASPPWTARERRQPEEAERQAPEAAGGEATAAPTLKAAAPWPKGPSWLRGAAAAAPAAAAHSAKAGAGPLAGRAVPGKTTAPAPWLRPSGKRSASEPLLEQKRWKQG